MCLSHLKKKDAFIPEGIDAPLWVTKSKNQPVSWSSPSPDRGNAYISYHFRKGKDRCGLLSPLCA